MVTAIFDGNYLLHRCMRVGELATLRTSKGKPTGGVMGFLKSLHKTLRNHSVQRCVVVFDGGISQRRRQRYPGYKGSKHRTPDDPLFEEILDPEKALYLQEFSQQLRYLQLMLRYLAVRVIRLPGWEADDLCYRIATYYNQSPGTVLLVSDDQDYLQAVHEWKEGDQYGSLRVYRPIADELITLGNFEETQGHRIGQHLLWRAIVGDSSDKIKGVEGVGSGWMRKIFAQYKGNTVYPFEDFFLFCMNHPTKTIRKVSDQLDVVIRNYEIMALHLEPYPKETEHEVLSLLLEPCELSLRDASRFMHELELQSILAQFHLWITLFQQLR